MSDLAPMREQVYADPRPKEHFDRFHERSRTREPDWAYELTRMLTSLYAYTFLRARAISSEKVPGAGAVILAPNHFSFMDHFLMGCYIRRKVRFMAKSQLFKPGPMQFVYTHGGVFPVRRGARDEETFITAETILGRGGAITMYCEGGRSRTGKVAEQAKRGIGRLALETGAPVVPIAIHGSSRIRNWKRLQFPEITVQYGDAIRWECIEHPTPEQQQAVADEVLLQIRALYAGLQEHGRKGVLRRAREQRRARRVAVQYPCSLRSSCAGAYWTACLSFKRAPQNRSLRLGRRWTRRAKSWEPTSTCVLLTSPRRLSLRSGALTCWSSTAPACLRSEACVRASRRPGT
jgi:1-acyl-sn-glycerol-3-phosphate acyltransferase